MDKNSNTGSDLAVEAHRLVSLSHADAIWEVFGEFFEDWMDESDKLEFVDTLCAEIGTSLEQLNAQIEEGIKNGHSVGKQIDRCKMVLRSFLG